MPRRLNITAARNQLLSLPEKLAPGESVEVVRHRRTVLKIVRPGLEDDETETDPFAILDRSLSRLSRPKGLPPRNLAARYKHYLYGKKN